MGVNDVMVAGKASIERHYHDQEDRRILRQNHARMPAPEEVPGGKGAHWILSWRDQWALKSESMNFVRFCSQCSGQTLATRCSGRPGDPQYLGTGRSMTCNGKCEPVHSFLFKGTVFLASIALAFSPKVSVKQASRKH